HLLYAQEDGVVSFNLPVRNSLKFNRFLINPTFSFVREQSTIVSFYNKRQWVQFDNAPQTYLVSYSGRFRENEGISVGLFQQNYGVLTTFGAVANFAHNVMLQEDSNLTFGMNVGFYKSGLDKGKVITNYPDPSLESIPSNALITVNPGINYGTAFLDFGLSVNNLILYNLKTSKVVEDDPEQSIQAHIMHTGYLDTYGFFDKSKFSALLKTEVKKDKTVVSGLMMFAIPKGIWAQAGYNSVYGMSGGIGLNITPKISLEYNYEKGIGNLSNFGSSHEVVFAYKFKSNSYYYGDDEEEGAIIPPAEVRKSVPAQPKESSILSPEDAQKLKELKLALAAQKEERRLQKLKEIADAAAKAKADSLNQTKLAADARAKADALAQAKLAADNKAKADAIAQAKLDADNKAKADALAQAKLDADNKAKADALAQAKLAADAKAKADALAQVKLDADNKAKADALAQAKLDAENKAKLAATPKDATTKSMDDLSKLVEESKNTQQQLLMRLGETVANKEKDLKELKEENDLSEKGIFKEPKPFKSVSAENNALEALKLELVEVNKTQTIKIRELENLYKERLKKVPNKEDETNQYYLKAIETLKQEQLKVLQSNTNLIASLEKIKTDTEIEKKRRIKRAGFENDQSRYLKDKATLSLIKEKTAFSSVPLKAEDFDSGDEQSTMQILKNIKNVESGYYLVVAVHDNVAKRDEFLTKAVAAGQTNIDFFYDINTSKYFIYYNKFDNIEEAKKALESKGSKPYNGKMSLAKIEN
ncbi:MAG: PorP/SprF family type IX secretion system membrane protein, partial [Flavobacterium sp.]|nr:PorP/SprF family type IX secretion system membrane protein [Flavobacterium sp.]